MKKSTIIIIVVVALLAIWGVSGYNGLVTMDENVSGQWSNVETISTSCRPDTESRKHSQRICVSRKGNAGRCGRSP